MVNPHVAWQRRQEFARAMTRNPKLTLSDMRFIAYEVPIDLAAEPAGGDAGTPIPQAFPNGVTLVLGISASVKPDGQPINPFIEALDRFRILFQYNANQSGLMVGNPMSIGGIASAVFGRRGDMFPAIEIPLGANETILATAQNITPERLRGNIVYHCLIWKQGQ